MKLVNFDIDTDEFLAQYYRSISAKLYDYRSEQEWRLVMTREYYWKYSFPYVNRIILGKDMSDDRIQRVTLVADKLNVPVFIQTISREGNTFEHKKRSVQLFLRAELGKLLMFLHK